MRRFELTGDGANKFWEVWTDGVTLYTRFGKIGSPGQTKLKKLATAALASKEADVVVARKIKEGYAETGAVPAKAKPKPAAKEAKKPSPEPAPPPPSSPAVMTEGERSIVLDPETAAEVVPRHPAPPDPRTVEALYAIVAARFALWWKDSGEKFRKNKLERVKDENTRSKIEGWLDRLDAVHESFVRQEIRRADPIAEATYGLQLYEIRDEVALWWAKAMGGAFVVRAFASTFGINWWGIYHHLMISPTEMHPMYPVAYDDIRAMRGIRRAIAGLDEAEVSAARKEAEAIRAEAPLALRVALAYLFPDSWTAEDADAVIAAAAGDNASWLYTSGMFSAPLLGATTNLDVADRIASLLAKGRDEAVERGLEHGATLLAALGPRAHGPLAKLLEASKSRNRKKAARLMTCIVAPESARSLAGLLEDRDKEVRKRAVTWLTAHVGLARPALEELIARRAKVSEACRSLLDTLPATERPTAPAGPAATPDELPAILRRPPWSADAGRTRPTIPEVKGLTELPYAERIVWPPGEKESALDQKGIGEMLRGWGTVSKTAPARSKEMDASVRAHLVKHESGQDWTTRVSFAGALLDLTSDEAGLGMWNNVSVEVFDPAPDDLRYILARWDLAALSRVLEAFAIAPTRAATVVPLLDTPRVAPFVAEALSRMKSLTAPARKWLATHVEAASVGLIPRAVASGKELSEKERRYARAALRSLPEKAVLAIAAKYGEPAKQAMTAVFALDPLDDVPARASALPGFAKNVPSPALRSGKVLPPQATEAILTMLSFARLDDPYPGIAIVREACDPGSLAEMAWGLFQQWMLAGAEGKEDWALLALGHFGDDSVVRRLTPRIREWPGESAHQRAVKGLDVLAAIGSDLALMNLDRIAEKLKFKGLQTQARAKIEAIAEARGLTRDELADRIAPTLDLDPDGSKTFAFGAERTFLVGFDEHLVPYVREAGSEKRLTDLPKPGKSDDAAQAKAATEAWRALKKDAKAVAQSQILRLERAMCTGRRWSEEEMRTLLVAHPLVFHLVRRLVWARFEANATGAVPGEALFRVAEDRTLANADDARLTLAPDALVGIVHPLALAEATRKTWSERLAEYELIQPFDQLARALFVPSKDEAKAVTIDRASGLTVATGKVLELEDRGWRRGMPQDAGWIWDIQKVLPGSVLAELSLDGGILAGDLAESPKEQTLHPVKLSDGRGGPVKAGDLDPIVYSELVRDLEMLRPDA